MECCIKVYETRKKLFGEEDPDTLSALHSIAVFHLALGDYQKSWEIGCHVYELRKKVLGEDHTDTMLTYTLLSKFIIIEK